MRIKILIITALLLSTLVAAADWKEVNVKYTTDRKSVGYCKDPNQCLVSNAFSDNWDNLPERYWSETLNQNKPKCITTGQYISDNYCDNGIWSSRTKLIAEHLLATALNTTPNNFSIFCDTYKTVLNRYAYSTDYGTVTSYISTLCIQPGNKRSDICVNNICVMRYGQSTAFGMAINTDINGAKSTLQALNMSPSECDSAIDNDAKFDPCGNGLWYDHNTNSIIYAPDVALLPVPTSVTNDFFMLPYNKLKDYVYTVVHKPDIVRYNYTFFNLPPQFQQVYMAKDEFDFFYSFRQKNVTLAQITYAGWYLSNIKLPDDTCSRIIKRYDSWANCEEQPNPSEFYIAAHRTPPTKTDQRASIVDAWEEMEKIRVSP